MENHRSGHGLKPARTGAAAAGQSEYRPFRIYCWDRTRAACNGLRIIPGILRSGIPRFRHQPPWKITAAGTG